MEDFLKKNGCKSIFLLAKEHEQAKTDLDTKSIGYLADKLLQFMEYREAIGENVDAQQAADSLIRLMPCIKMVHLSYFIIFNMQLDYNKISHIVFLIRIGLFVHVEKRNTLPKIILQAISQGQTKTKCHRKKRRKRDGCIRC